MSKPHWVGSDLYIGRVKVGSVGECINDNGEARRTGYAALPGGLSCFRGKGDIVKARNHISTQTHNRIRAMFGAGPEEIEAAIERQKALRVVSVAILNAIKSGGDITAQMSDDLQRALFPHGGADKMRAPPDPNLSDEESVIE